MAMFAAGETNEDTWVDILRRVWPGVIKRETEIPIEFEIAGVKVTGRPDIVLCEADGTPTLGLELKGIFSYNSARDVLLEGKPKDENLVQAAVYSKSLGIPWVLCYTNVSHFPINFFDKKRWPNVKKMKPDFGLFYLRWTEDVLEYREDIKSEWLTTVITKQGIDNYYALILEMRAKKDIGPLPADKTVTGGTHPFNHCDYCDFTATCKMHFTYDEWVDAARKQTE
jgi:hypothetical protein